MNDLPPSMRFTGQVYLGAKYATGFASFNTFEKLSEDWSSWNFRGLLLDKLVNYLQALVVCA